MDTTQLNVEGSSSLWANAARFGTFVHNLLVSTISSTPYLHLQIVISDPAAALRRARVNESEGPRWIVRAPISACSTSQWARVSNSGLGAPSTNPVGHIIHISSDSCAINSHFIDVRPGICRTIRTRSSR